MSLLENILKDQNDSSNELHYYGCDCRECKLAEQENNDEFSNLFANWFGWLNPVSGGGNLLNDSQVEDAVEYNRAMGPRIGWINHYNDIVEKVLKLDHSPDEWSFARSIADWQVKNGFSGKYVDGKLGSGTWSKMLPYLNSAPNVSSSFNDSNKIFRNFNDIESFFIRNTGLSFINWFNSKIAGRGHWRSRRISTDPTVLERFKSIWDNIRDVFESDNINLNQFLALTAIMINENPKFSTRSEYASSLKYFFESVRLKSGRRKISYNTKYNKTAYELFNDPTFVEAHGHLNPKRLQFTNDRRWNSSKYPYGFSPEINRSINGFIMEADFYKFRGRGFIQITFRGNYRRQIEAILQYNGRNRKILFYKKKWLEYLESIGKTRINRAALDLIASKSSNKDWDDLFSDNDLAFPLISLKTYYKYKSRTRTNPLRLIPSGSINTWAVKDKIKRLARAQGGPDYQERLYNRVKQMLDGIK